MNDGIKELIRYQIPGYICIAYAVFLLLPFVDSAQLMKPGYFQLFDLLVACIASGIAVGWILFQLYHRLCHEALAKRYAWRRPLRILKCWDTSSLLCDQFRERLMDYALHKSGLREMASACWSHAQCKYIIGRMVPFASVALAFVAFLAAQFTPFQQVFSTASIGSSLVKSAIIWFGLFLLFFWISLKTPQTLNEVECYIVISLIENEGYVREIIENKYADRTWTCINRR